MAPTAQVDPQVLTQEPWDALAVYRGQQAVIDSHMRSLTQNAPEEQESNPDSPAAQGVRSAIFALQQQKTRVASLISTLEHGYAQITLPSASSHATGHVEDPRLVKIPLTPLWLGVILAMMVSMVVLGSFNLLTQAWTMATLPILVVESLPFIILGNRNESRLRAAGIPTYGTQLFYKGTVPAHAWGLYQTAKKSGLFATIGIWAPREAFRKLTFGDPIIFGEVEGQYFLIAQFNLSLDLGGRGR